MLVDYLRVQSQVHISVGCAKPVVTDGGYECTFTTAPPRGKAFPALHPNTHQNVDVQPMGMDCSSEIEHMLYKQKVARSIPDISRKMWHS